MIPDIRNSFARRTALVLTVLGVVVCLGPLHLIRAALRCALQWVEDEFEADLRDAWRGPKSATTERGTK